MNRCSFVFVSLVCLTVASAAPPNVVIIFMDDMGYADINPFGANEYETPNLNRMATEGRLFTDFVTSSAVCSASRAALLTGCYHQRVGISGALGRSQRSASIPMRRRSPNYASRKATPQRFLENGISGTIQNSCRRGMVSISTTDCPTATICGRCIRERWRNESRSGRADSLASFANDPFVGCFWIQNHQSRCATGRPAKDDGGVYEASRAIHQE